MNKDLIKKRFSRKLNSYNENARIQKQMAEKLIKMLASYTAGKSNLSVLEIGCGTGLLTELAVKNIPVSAYTALDIVSECENYIKNINSNIEFISSDIEEYIEKTEKTFDLIISNASLQWIENLPDFIKKLTEKLNTGGKLVFSTFGKENFREIYYVLGKTLPYYSKRELDILLAPYSPNITEEIYVIAFDSPISVLKHIKNTGVNAISSEVWTKKDLKSFENAYNSFCSNHPTLTYNPLYIKLGKIG